MDVEVIATSAVKTKVSTTNFLSPYISEKDKEPIWDGHIYVFKNKRRANKDLIGRVPVQIKGVKSSNIFADKVSYSVRVDDLEKILTVSGTMFFVVYIDELGKTKIYFSELLPYKIKRILHSLDKDQLTTSIEFNTFPDNRNEIVELFLNFLQNMRLQKSVNEKIYSIDELTEMGQLSNLTIGYTSIKSNAAFPFEFLFKNETYLYASTPIGIQIPVDVIKGVEAIKTTINNPISVNGIKYYDNFSWVRKKEFFEIRIGKSIVIRNYINSDISEIEWELKGTLQQRITDLKFSIALLNSKSFFIRETLIPINESNADQLKLNQYRKELNELLLGFNKIKKALDAAGVKVDLDCDAITENCESAIELLVEAFVFGKNVSFGNWPHPIGAMSFANLRVLLCTSKQKDGSYQLFNFFEKRLNSFISSGSLQEGVAVSQFIILKRTDFMYLSNVNFDVILNDIVSIGYNDTHAMHVTNLLLEMLHAFDSGCEEKEELIKTALAISKWLLDNGRNDISILNNLQVVARVRKLSEDELDELYSLIESGESSEMVLIGAYILLNDYKGAKRNINKLSSKEQEKFRSFPLYNLCKGMF